MTNQLYILQIAFSTYAHVIAFKSAFYAKRIENGFW